LAGNQTRSNALALTHGTVWLVGLASFGFAYRREHFLETERQRVAEALHSTKERFRIAAETSNDLVYEWDLGQNIQWFGDIDGLLGYDLNEFPRTLQAFVDSLHPEHAEPIMAAVHAHVQQGVPYATEYRMRRKDGTYHWWTARGMTERSADGNPVRMIGTVTDITERKRAEQALQDSEERLRNTIVEAPFPILVHAEDGAVIMSSKVWHEITGYSPDELRTTGDWTARAYGVNQARVMDDIERLYSLTGREAEGEYTIRTASGESRIWDFSSAPLGRLADGRRAAISMAVDVTERKRVEERLDSTLADLERSNKELEQFAYIASHDLQEPLRMVASYTQLLAQRYEGQLDDKADKYIAYAVDGAVRMQRLINDLLEYSRVSTRARPPGTVDAEKTLDEVKKNLSATLLENQATVTHDDLPAISVDATQFLQLLQNLIGNAIKFHREEAPHVHISARDLGAEWLFSVRDNGIGFEEKFAGRIFVIFQRLHTRLEYPGTGIGLALCKRIVERHGGKIWCESVSGQGTTFYFTIPKPKEA
jgi:PAS domain S-box-containing protein